MSNFSNRKKPQNIENILAKVLKNKKITEKARSFDFITSWEKIVGEEYARVSTPERLNKGLLTVRVIDNVYSQELSMQKPLFLEKLTELGYSGAVSDIKFVSGNPREFKTR
jgi:hypothetical protein